MGEVYVPVEIANMLTGARSRRIRMLADTGATLSIIPWPILERLGIETTGSVRFMLADGRRTTRRTGHAIITINGDSAPCRVVFGRAGDTALIGVTLLEQLGLGVDPVRRRLVPAPIRL